MGLMTRASRYGKVPSTPIFWWQPSFTSQAVTTSPRSEPQIVDEIVGSGDHLDSFRPYFKANLPVIVRNALVGDSLRKWNDEEYLIEKVGHDHVVDVEMGSNYASGSRFSLRFADYMDYIRIWKESYEKQQEIPRDQLVYLAQNDLPPGLAKDVEIPTACTDPSFGEGKVYNTMLWLGPSGTVSPLHFDPMNNFLMQVIGRKRVLLLPSSVDKGALYTGQEWGQQSNTSAVDDLETPDLDKFPLFAKIQNSVVRADLNPGDVLYIPAKWWHTVRSLEYSISVNTWWR